MSQNLNILGESAIDEAECSRMVADTIRSLVNARGLQLECASLALNIAFACFYV